MYHFLIDCLYNIRFTHVRQGGYNYIHYTFKWTQQENITYLLFVNVEYFQDCTLYSRALRSSLPYAANKQIFLNIQSHQFFYNVAKSHVRCHQVGNTSSRKITAVQQRGPRLARGWVLSLSLSKILFQSLKRKDMIVNSTKSQGLTLSLSIQTLPGRRREALYFIFSFMLFTQHFLTKQTLIF